MSVRTPKETQNEDEKQTKHHTVALQKFVHSLIATNRLEVLKRESTKPAKYQVNVICNETMPQKIALQQKHDNEGMFIKTVMLYATMCTKQL